jgi:hypothetical protein
VLRKHSAKETFDKEASLPIAKKKHSAKKVFVVCFFDTRQRKFQIESPKQI